MDPIQTQSPVETSIPASSDSSSKMNSAEARKVLAIVVIVLALIGAYVLYDKYTSSPQAIEEEDIADNSFTPAVEVKNTPPLDGKKVVPAGFPRSIPVESANIAESATTEYPDQNARQLSVYYRSSKSVDALYAEYLNYMKQNGYQVTEGSNPTPTLKSLFGQKQEANLSVTIDNKQGVVMAQVSYLIKSVSQE